MILFVEVPDLRRDRHDERPVRLHRPVRVEVDPEVVAALVDGADRGGTVPRVDDALLVERARRIASASERAEQADPAGPERPGPHEREVR